MPEKYVPSKYWEERLVRLPDLCGTGTLGQGSLFNEYQYRAKERAFRRILRRQREVLKGARVVELGCGVGFFADLALGWGAERYDGVDISPTTVERLKERFTGAPAGFLAGDFTDPAIPDRLSPPYDVVLAMDVLYHAVDDELWEKALANCAALLGPSGLLVLTDELSRTRAAGLTEAHVRLRGEAMYREALPRAGLKIEAVHPLYVFNNPPLNAEGVSKAVYDFIFRYTTAFGKRPRLGRPYFWLLHVIEGMMCRAGFSPSLRILLARKG